MSSTLPDVNFTLVPALISKSDTHGCSYDQLAVSIMKWSGSKFIFVMRDGKSRPRLDLNIVLPEVMRCKLAICQYDQLTPELI